MKKVAKLLMIDPEDKYLLMYRSDHPTFGKDPDLPGGTMEDNETLLETMLREVKEEAGVVIDAKSVDAVYSGTKYSAHDTHYTLFIAKVKTRPEIIMSWEHSSYEWLERDKFLQKARNANDTYMHMVSDVMSKCDNAVVNGEILHANNPDRKDYLFRVSLKSVIFNEAGDVLVVKERGRDWWDIPGGGMDHGESVKEVLARELQEEVSLVGDFEYEVILTEDPRYLASHNLYQMRITFLVKPKVQEFGPGDDSDEVMFVDPLKFEDSELVTERKIYEYSQLAKSRLN